MRGQRGLLIYCSDYKCSHLISMSGDQWPDGMRLSARGEHAMAARSLRQAPKPWPPAP
jgi:hypothetical protein